jgi:hypothetical protein
MKCKKKSLLWSVITSPVVVLSKEEKCKRMEDKEIWKKRERFVGSCVVLHEKREMFGRESDLTCLTCTISTC